ncbi:MAG: hypothetical protein NTZ01_02740, partial [Verrucomicrobia bacterium]|nr:hypothetical protein [Verrucomicrobiota bacterium]
MRLSTAVSCVFLAVFSLLNSAHAIVFFSQGNDYNLTNPGGSLPWDNVVQIRSSTGPTGSWVYLGNGYVLTAGHVGPVDNVRIGSTDFALDPAAPISIGTSDMKLVHLAS